MLESTSVVYHIFVTVVPIVPVVVVVPDYDGGDVVEAASVDSHTVLVVPVVVLVLAGLNIGSWSFGCVVLSPADQDAKELPYCYKHSVLDLKLIVTIQSWEVSLWIPVPDQVSNVASMYGCHTVEGPVETHFPSHKRLAADPSTCQHFHTCSNLKMVVFDHDTVVDFERYYL